MEAAPSFTTSANPEIVLAAFWAASARASWLLLFAPLTSVLVSSTRVLAVFRIPSLCEMLYVYYVYYNIIYVYYVYYNIFYDYFVYYNIIYVYFVYYNIIYVYYVYYNIIYVYYVYYYYIFVTTYY